MAAAAAARALRMRWLGQDILVAYLAGYSVVVHTVEVFWKAIAVFCHRYRKLNPNPNTVAVFCHRCSNPNPNPNPDTNAVLWYRYCAVAAVA